MKTTNFHILGALMLLCSWIAPSAGQDQEIGVDVCHCAPNTYEFTLDFSLFCPPVNITIGDAVQATTCMVSPFGDPTVTDLIPVAVQSIDILELNQNLQVMMQENIAGNFGDGDTFQYTSYAALPGEVVDPDDLPRAIQININGINQFEESIINVYLITFTNNCGSYPVLFEGQSAGWTRFVSVAKFVCFNIFVVIALIPDFLGHFACSLTLDHQAENSVLWFPVMRLPPDQTRPLLPRRQVRHPPLPQ
jgi:hypothetical protein